MRVVAFTGLPGAGKSDAVDEARRRGVPIVIMGDFVRAEARTRGLELRDENLGEVARDMRKRHGADVFAERTADDVLRRHAGAALVVIDGVRSLDEIATLRKRLGDRFHLVAIEAPEPARHARLRARGRSDDSTSLDAIRRRDEREKGWGLLDAIRQSDSKLVNDGPLSKFHRDVAALFDRLTVSAEGGSSTAPRRPVSGTRP